MSLGCALRSHVLCQVLNQELLIELIQHIQLQTCFYVFVVREIGMRMEMGIRMEMREMGIRMKMREIGIRMEMKEIVMDVAGYVSTMLSLITRTSLA